MDESELWGDEANIIIFSAVKGLWAPGYEYDDIINEARVGLWEASLSWNPDRSPWRGYAIMVARRKVIDLVVTANRRKHSFLKAYCDLENSGAYNIPEEIEVTDNKKKVRELLKLVQLSEKEQAVLNLWLKDYKYMEIAKELNIPYKTVDNTYQRVLKKLRELEIPTPESLLSLGAKPALRGERKAG